MLADAEFIHFDCGIHSQKFLVRFSFFFGNSKSRTRDQRGQKATEGGRKVEYRGDTRPGPATKAHSTGVTMGEPRSVPSPFPTSGAGTRTMMAALPARSYHWRFVLLEATAATKTHTQATICCNCQDISWVYVCSTLLWPLFGAAFGTTARLLSSAVRLAPKILVAFAQAWNFYTGWCPANCITVANRSGSRGKSDDCLLRICEETLAEPLVQYNFLSYLECFARNFVLYLKYMKAYSVKACQTL